MGKVCPNCHQTIPTLQGLAVDAERGEVRYGGFSLGLSIYPFRLIEALAAAPGRVVSKGAIADAMYFDRHGEDPPQEKIIDVFVCKLRPRLKPMGLWIETRWGRGYELLVPGLASREIEFTPSAVEVSAMSYGGR